MNLTLMADQYGHQPPYVLTDQELARFEAMRPTLREHMFYNLTGHEWPFFTKRIFDREQDQDCYYD